MIDKIRWGVLSTSRHAAATWIPACQASQRGEVVAVASRDASRARQYASEHGIPRSFGDYESLLASPDVDAVYIPLPNHLHKEWTIKAAGAGKHVLCEKPLGLDAAQAEEMVAACHAAGVTLAEAFQWRHHPHAERTRELLRDGAIGDLRLIEAGFGGARQAVRRVSGDSVLRRFRTFLLLTVRASRGSGRGGHAGPAPGDKAFRLLERACDVEYAVEPDEPEYGERFAGQVAYRQGAAFGSEGAVYMEHHADPGGTDVLDAGCVEYYKRALFPCQPLDGATQRGGGRRVERSARRDHHRAARFLTAIAGAAP